MLFIILLLVSFFIIQQECCDCCCNESNRNEKCCDCGGGCSGNDCNCNGAGEAGIIICIYIIFLIAFALLYFIGTLCGKHIVRIISIISLCLIDIINVAISIKGGNDLSFNNYLIMIIIVESISILCNSLSIILPNFEKCKIFRYNDNIYTKIDFKHNLNDEESQIDKNKKHTKRKEFILYFLKIIII